MQTVSGKNKPAQEGEDRWKDLRTKIEAQSEATYSTARIWVRRVTYSTSASLSLDLERERGEHRFCQRNRRGQRGKLDADFVG